MRAKTISTPHLAWFSLAVVLLTTGQSSRAADLKFETLLVWGTNDKQPPDFKYKPVGPEVQKILKDLPLKWNHYFEVSRKAFDMPVAGTKRVPLSEKCEIEVKDLGHAKIEVKHFGKGQEVLKQSQVLPKGESLVIAGNAPN